MALEFSEPGRSRRIRQKGRDRIFLKLYLTGARDGAVASFKLRHIDISGSKVTQDARQVKTKRSKTFVTYFFPVGDDIRLIVENWVNYLRQTKLWGDDDPLFPATDVGIGSARRFEPLGLARRHWEGAGAIRKIFKTAFAAADLPYANPHSFRHALVQLAYQRRLTPEQFKCWSQNLGHDSILTTFSSYGPITIYRQAEVMREIGSTRAEVSEKDEILARIVALASGVKS